MSGATGADFARSAPPSATAIKTETLSSVVSDRTLAVLQQKLKDAQPKATDTSIEKNAKAIKAHPNFGALDLLEGIMKEGYSPSDTEKIDQYIANYVTNLPFTKKVLTPQTGGRRRGRTLRRRRTGKTRRGRKH